jgi:hypothetical protein
LIFSPSSSDPLVVDVAVWVQPGSSRSRVVGNHGEPPRLKIQIAAPAVEGAANEELVRFLAKLLKAKVEVIRGEHSRSKTVRIRGLPVSELEAKLAPSTSR